MSFGRFPWAFTVRFDTSSAILTESVDCFIGRVAIWIDIFGKPFTQFVSHVGDMGGVFRQIYKILRFVRIFRKIVEFMRTIRITMDVFPFA